MHTILSLSSSNLDSQVLDTAYGSHVCKSLQGLQNLRVLKKGNFKLYGAGGESIQAEVMGTYMLKLPSRKVLELENYYYIPKIIRNIISVSLLLQRDFEINGKGTRCSISFSNEHIYDGIVNNGLLILSLNDNIFYVDKNKKYMREYINNTLL